MRAIALSLILVAAPASALDIDVAVSAICKDGKVVGVVVRVPELPAGVLTVPLPPNPCAQEAPKPEKKPAPPSV